MPPAFIADRRMSRGAKIGDRVATIATRGPARTDASRAATARSRRAALSRLARRAASQPRATGRGATAAAAAVIRVAGTEARNLEQPKVVAHRTSPGTTSPGRRRRHRIGGAHGRLTERISALRTNLTRVGRGTRARRERVHRTHPAPRNGPTPERPLSGRGIGGRRVGARIDLGTNRKSASGTSGPTRAIRRGHPLASVQIRPTASRSPRDRCRKARSSANARPVCSTPHRRPASSTARQAARRPKKRLASHADGRCRLMARQPATTRRPRSMERNLANRRRRADRGGSERPCGRSGTKTPRDTQRRPG